ncbi:MAG: hypothetical protein KTV68_14650 [Acidimicrobiia bacterium]|nr:hypothetical protein [Acidimicrobiia bacterium]MCY4435201.1 hypothetical protein [bacterium]
MGDLRLRPSNALDGLRVGISVSDSADLPMLGLHARHAELALAEIARSVLLLSGRLVYGGRVSPPGFSQFLLRELERYGDHPDSLTLCLAAPEHETLTPKQLKDLNNKLQARGRVVRLSPRGLAVDRESIPSPPNEQPSESSSYSAMRHYLCSTTDARVILGGQLEQFQGNMPGIIEEAINSIKAEQPLYVVGGFGGAAALVAKTLNIDSFDWAPSNFPIRPDDKRIDDSLSKLRSAADQSNVSIRCCGLDELELQKLSMTHRPKEIASIIVNGLAAVHTNSH